MSRVPEPPTLGSHIAAFCMAWKSPFWAGFLLTCGVICGLGATILAARLAKLLIGLLA